MIRIEGVRKRYGAVAALRGVDFEVEQGETFGIIGPNGAGKTTLLKILLGLVRPDAGRIAIDGVDLHQDPVGIRGRIGYVPQHAAFEATATGEESLHFLARLRGVPVAQVEPCADLVGVRALLGRRIGTLSGGQRQRLSLAAALLGDPPVLLLDEPTASLDPSATAAFRRLLERLGEEGRTIVLCSHLLADVERLCDRVLVLLEGQVAAVEVMREAQAVLSVRVEDPAEAGRVAAGLGMTLSADTDGWLRANVAAEDQARLVAALHEGGVRVSGLRTRRPTLEDRFLAAIHEEGDLHASP